MSQEKPALTSGGSVGLPLLRSHEKTGGLSWAQSSWPQAKYPDVLLTTQMVKTDSPGTQEVSGSKGPPPARNR